MSADLSNRLAGAPVVPLIGENDAPRAVKTAQALADGGLTVIEVVLRSADAQRGMEAILAETGGFDCWRRHCADFGSGKIGRGKRGAIHRFSGPCR